MININCTKSACRQPLQAEPQPGCGPCFRPCRVRLSHCGCGRAPHGPTSSAGVRPSGGVIVCGLCLGDGDGWDASVPPVPASIRCAIPQVNHPSNPSYRTCPARRVRQDTGVNPLARKLNRLAMTRGWRYARWIVDGTLEPIRRSPCESSQFSTLALSAVRIPWLCSMRC
jgi:hypothetical protein